MIKILPYMLIAYIALAASPVWADKIIQPHSGDQSQSQTLDQAQSQTQDMSQTQSATGGSGGNVGAFDASSRFYAINPYITQPTPSDGPGCPLWVPGDGEDRSWSFLLATVSGNYVRDEDCFEILQTDKAHARSMDEREMQLREREMALREAEFERRKRIDEATFEQEQGSK